MMPLALVIVVLAALTIGDLAPTEPANHGLLRAACVAGAMLALGLFAFGGSIALAGEIGLARAPRELGRAWYDRLKSIHFVLWIGTAAAVLYVLDWTRIVRCNWGLQGAFLLDELLILAPVLLPPLVAWAAFYEVDRVLDADDSGESPATRWEYLLLHIRHYYALVLAPVLFLIAVQDGVSIAAPWIADSSWTGLICVPPLALAVVLLPWVVRAIWPSIPLEEGPLRDRLLRAAKRFEISVSEILVWQTNGTLTNAAVVGLLPQFRYVLLSDALLAKLADDEIEAVFCHELGHLKAGHLPLRLALVAAPLLVWGAILAAVPEAPAAIQIMLADLGVEPDLQKMLLLPLAAVGYAIVALGWYSTALEYQADLFACRTGKEAPNGEPIAPEGVAIYHRALDRLAEVSGADRRSSSWMHPSIGQRLTFLERVGADPSVADRFEGRLRIVAWGILGVLMLAIALMAMSP